MTTTLPTPLPAGLTAGSYAIDPAHSEVGFSARHAMVTTVRGSFSDVEGTVVLDGDANLITVGATIRTASVDTRSADRDGHLRSPDFFDAENHPEMRYRSTGVRVHDSGFVLEGELTTKDVTRPVPLEVTAEGVSTDPFGNIRAGSSAETEIKVKITLDVSAVKQA